jgi:hypothetical protein
MNWVDTLLTSPHVARLASVLVHSLWQALAAAVALAALLRCISVQRTRLRFGLSLGALCSVVVAGCVTWSVAGMTPAPGDAAARMSDGQIAEQSRVDSQHPAASVGVTPATGAISPPASPVSRAPAAATLDSIAAPWALASVIVWGLGACIMLCRGVRDLATARRIAAGPECVDSQLRRPRLSSLAEPDIQIGQYRSTTPAPPTATWRKLSADLHVVRPR